jgi:hypothetical protein
MKHRSIYLQLVHTQQGLQLCGAAALYAAALYAAALYAAALCAAALYAAALYAAAVSKKKLVSRKIRLSQTETQFCNAAIAKHEMRQ